MRYWLLILLFGTNAAFAQNNYKSTQVTVHGKKMSYLSYSLNTRKPGDPVLVFESGLGSGGGAYAMLFDGLSQKTAGIAYDRNGLGASAPDTTVKSDGDVVKRLHDLLTELKIQPPYILVGHSLGGPFVRLFTAYFPDEVAGLMFIDPTDFMLTAKDDEDIKNLSHSAMGYRELQARMMEMFSADTSNSIGTRNEMIRVRNANRKGYFSEYISLPPLRDIPVTVLISYNRPIELQEKELGDKLKINMEPWFRELNRVRIQNFARMIENNHNSEMVLLPRYSHGIHHQSPALGVKEILDLYDRVVAKKR